MQKHIQCISEQQPRDINGQEPWVTPQRMLGSCRRFAYANIMFQVTLNASHFSHSQRMLINHFEEIDA